MSQHLRRSSKVKTKTLTKLSEVYILKSPNCSSYSKTNTSRQKQTVMCKCCRQEKPIKSVNFPDSPPLPFPIYLEHQILNYFHISSLLVKRLNYSFQYIRVFKIVLCSFICKCNQYEAIHKIIWYFKTHLAKCVHFFLFTEDQT